MILKKIIDLTNTKHWDYFILVARFLLAWTFLRYGYSKLTGGQFGLKPKELITPLQDLNLFRISFWAYLILPIIVILLEFALFLPKVIFELIFYPNKYSKYHV